jgi:hypothetical protein
MKGSACSLFYRSDRDPRDLDTIYENQLNIHERLKPEVNWYETLNAYANGIQSEENPLWLISFILLIPKNVYPFR